MNEADTPENGAWREPPNSANAAQSENLGCPFYSVVPNQIAISKLPPARTMETQPRHEYHRFQIDVQKDYATGDAIYTDSEQDRVLTLGNEQWESQTLSDKDEENIVSEASDIPSEDWVAEPDRDRQAAVDTEFQQLLALNQELQAANDKLYNQVAEMTLALAESEKALQLQKKRSSITETMLNQHSSELSATQKQIESLYQQLESSQQNAQRQETLVETYKAQFEFSQQRLAQLERECALLQTNHHEQSQHLLQSETVCRELRTRLMRQQRQTLQFKAALEKCLETPIPTPSDELADSTIDDRDSSEYLSPSLKKFRSVFVNADPIRPWSADSETSFFETENFEDTVSPANDDVTLENESQPDPFTSNRDEKTVTWKPANSASPSLEAQIDSVIQMFLISQSNSTSQQMPFQLDSDEHEESESYTSANLLNTNDKAESNTLQNRVPYGWDAILPEENSFDSSSGNTITVNSESVIKSNNTPIYAEPVIETTNPSPQDEGEDYWAEVSQLTHLDLPATDSPLHSHNTNDESSPSPVVYPKRPPKGRKSLASVELPKFRPPQS